MKINKFKNHNILRELSYWICILWPVTFNYMYTDSLRILWNFPSFSMCVQNQGLKKHAFLKYQHRTWNLTTFCHLLQKTWLNFLLQCHDNALIVPEFPLSDIAFYPVDFIIRMLYYIYQYALYNNHCILSTNKSVFNRINHIPHQVQVSTF